MALLSGGGQAQYVTVPEGLLMSIPEGLTMHQAAAIPEVWLTAFQLLHLLGEDASCLLHMAWLSFPRNQSPQTPSVLQPQCLTLLGQK